MFVGSLVSAITLTLNTAALQAILDGNIPGLSPCVLFAIVSSYCASSRCFELEKFPSWKIRGWLTLTHI